MRCPLCGGPLHVEDEARFACERGHELEPTAMRAAASSRVSVALWMAIEALESEAVALRLLASMDGADSGGVARADQAEEDARVLREVATGHAPSAGAGS